MGAQSIREIVDYLRRLAPAFFAERMRGASDLDIRRLAEAARAPLCESHREFLLLMGATPATALNPFLNDRDYCVDTLLAAYSDMDLADERLPERIVFFSSSDILGETLFLRNGQHPDEDPEIGDIRFETGEFILRDKVRFENWLRWFAFVFRLSQPEHQLAFAPPWNGEQRRWEGDPVNIERILGNLGLQPTFRLIDGMLCLDRGDVAVSLHDDGSGTLAGDDLQELRKIANVLDDHVSLSFSLEATHDRLHAPRS
jgi:hypothetical protein